MLDGQWKRGEIGGMWCRQLAFCSDTSCGRESEFLGVHAGRIVTDGDGWSLSEEGMEGSVGQNDR